MNIKSKTSLAQFFLEKCKSINIHKPINLLFPVFLGYNFFLIIVKKKHFIRNMKSKIRIVVPMKNNARTFIQFQCNSKKPTMAKVKNKKSNLADAYAKRRKQQTQKKTLTPFEIHVNKDKQNVLGRKSKADRGLPGIARAKAISKRKNTLLVEYKVRDKDNIFLDRRIGEKNRNMSQEDRAMARFAAERVKAHTKKNIFNLNDDEVLTHRGQSLMDIEKYDDPRSDEDDYSDDNDKTGKLDKKFVGDAHFGGGVLSKLNSEMSRKDLIDQLIVESKKRKAERQKTREQTIDLTEKLDSEWRDLLPLVASSNKAMEKVEEKVKADDYDIAVRELKFEARGTPSDKLRSEEAVAKEEQEKLEKLEEDRLARMKGFSEEAEFQRRHRSADDLDDFRIEKIVEVSEDEEEDAKGILIKHDGLEEGEAGEDVEDEDEGEDAEDEGEEDEGAEDENEDEEDENEVDEEEEDEESEDDLSDLKASDSSEAEEDENEGTSDVEVEEPEKIVHTKNAAPEVVQENGVETDNSPKPNENFEAHVNMKEREAIMNQARKELPFTIKAPETYEELQTLFKDRNLDYQSVIVERLIKCYHWKLAEKNKDKLLKLFTFLLQYLQDSFSVNSVEELSRFLQILDRLCPHFYDLTHANPGATKSCLHDILKERHDDFEANAKVYPGLDQVRT